MVWVADLQAEVVEEFCMGGRSAGSGRPGVLYRPAADQYTCTQKRQCLHVDIQPMTSEAWQECNFAVFIAVHQSAEAQTALVFGVASHGCRSGRRTGDERWASARTVQVTGAVRETVYQVFETAR